MSGVAVQAELPFLEKGSWDPLRARLQNIRWSYSRRNTLEQCPRRYFFEYYGANALRGERAARLRTLKAVQNRHERSGTIAHMVIASYFRAAKRGDLWSAGRMIDWGCSILRRDIAFSQLARPNESGEREKYPPVLLQEYLYGLPNAGPLYRHAEEQLAERIRTFAESPALAKVRLDGSRPDSVVEGRAQVKGLGCRVDGTIDLAFRADGELRIIDWKLGEPERTGDGSLQLGTYALSLVSEGRAAIEDLHASKVYLSTGEVVGFSVNSDVLARVRARIVQDAERMAVLHEHGMRGVEEAFTPCRQQRVCSTCSFREVCPVGRQL